MRELEGTAVGVAPSPIDECFDWLSDLEAYPSWYPEGVKRAAVVSRAPDGVPSKVDTALTISRGVISFDHDVPLAVTLHRPRLVLFERVPNDERDREELQVSWRLHPIEETRTELTVAMRANLSLPPFLPGLGGIAEDIARGFLTAALRSLGG